MSSSRIRPLVLARTAERLRYIRLAVDVCGGHGPTAAQVLGINRKHFAQYVEWCVRRIRRDGGTVKKLPRFRRPARSIRPEQFSKLTTLAEHLTEWEAKYIRKALSQSGGDRQAASRLLGLKPCSLYEVIARRHPNLGDPRPARQRQSPHELRQFWRALLVLCRLMTACAMLGLPLLRTPVRHEPEVGEVAT